MEQENLESKVSQKPREAYLPGGKGFTRALPHLRDGMFPTSAPLASLPHPRREKEQKTISESHSPGTQPPAKRLKCNHHLPTPSARLRCNNSGLQRKELQDALFLDRHSTKRHKHGLKRKSKPLASMASANSG